MIILDTDVLTIIQRRAGREYEKLADRLDLVEDEVVVSIISFEEQMRGWLAFIARAQSAVQQTTAYAKLYGLLEDFTSRPVLEFSESCAAEFDSLVRARVRVGTMDLKIAAIAISHEALLVSRNLVDFRKVPGLRVEDWTT
ncbi:MAG: type II toxin-antitoxin system VapC family toxin [Verrucomicrobia bacterium]|nr:type II toxin-antitoxin system VapC family toxin [Verrucomicrobiota bacterium]